MRAIPGPEPKQGPIFFCSLDIATAIVGWATRAFTPVFDGYGRWHGLKPL